METKVCSCCKRELPVNLFVKNRTRKDGLGCWCKECNNKNNEKYRKNKEKMGWYDKFDIYIKNNRRLDCELIKDWQRCIKVLRESPSKTKEEVIRECNPRYSDEFRQMITYLVNRGFIQKEGYGVSTRYTIPALVKNESIQEWYQDFRKKYPHLTQSKEPVIHQEQITFSISYERSELFNHFGSITLQRAETGMYSYEELVAIKYLQDNGFEVKKIVKLELD